MAAHRTLIRGGYVVTVDPELGELREGDILIEDGRIAAVGPDLPVTDAEVIDATDRIVIPGFIDSHRHLWQSQIRNIAADWTLSQYITGILIQLGPIYRPEDTYIGGLLGALEALDSGITTILDWSHALNTPDHADAALDALEESASRAVLAHGNANSIWLGPTSADWSDVARLRAGRCASDSGLVTLAMALRGPDFGSFEASVEDWAAARALGLRITVHIGVGGFGNRHVAMLNEAGLLGPDTTYVHCSRLEDDELDMIAATGGSASVACEVEMHMGHGYPPTGRLVAAGVRPSLSIDVCTGIGGDMFAAMRSTLSMQRAMANDESLDAGITPDRLELTTHDVLEFATLAGARALGIEDRTGSLTPGKEADVVLLRTDRLNMFPVNNAVASVALAANCANVDTVLVRGRVVKRDGRLLACDIPRLRRLGEESRDYLLDAVAAPRHGSWAPQPFVTG
ncbi:MAG: 5-methylthioadenosine/S-adenosylhomocysteine deaminase [Solirubrobacteraceae bacterium]|jgi:cytosine/adenosine deaminase-related metal-dependent hydrolase|nr:5-methylthioadenosine/S-adenosylhomocysteine deaminase [Solirubrobacteraceae bacterium]